jgi:hypothetical protein
MNSKALREETEMKKSLLIVAAVMFVAGSAFAVNPPIGHIGIFRDATHYIGDRDDFLSSANTTCPPVYGQFYAWIWVWPGLNGLHAAEFAAYFPPTISTLASVKNPQITVERGALATGISIAFGEGSCQRDWVWLYALTLMNLAPIVPWTLPPSYNYPPLPGLPAMYVAIIPHPGTLPVPAYQAATCEAGYPIEPLVNWTPLWLCYDPTSGPLGVEQTNWGAIKSLF